MGFKSAHNSGLQYYCHFHKLSRSCAANILKIQNQPIDQRCRFSFLLCKEMRQSEECEFLHFHLFQMWLFCSLPTSCVLVLCPCAGCHDPRHANLQSHDAIRLRPDTPARPEHQQFVYTGGTAKAAATATTTTAGTAGKHRYNTHFCHLPLHPFTALRSEVTFSYPNNWCLPQSF